MVHFSVGATVLLDILAWFFIHMGISWVMLKMPIRWFSKDVFFLRRRAWETDWFYETVLTIKTWKSKLPDAAPWFKGGFPKKSLRDQSVNYLNRFLYETRRGEVSHWLCIMIVPVFLIWNSVGVFMVMILYALAVNLPCIFVQRYNRFRLLRIIALF